MTMAQWWQPDWGYLGLDIGVSLALFTLLRFSQGWWEGVSSQQELADRDNVAFGISTSGSLLAMAMVISGILPRTAAAGYLEQGLSLASFGLGGLLLIRISLWVNDRFAIDRVEKKTQILAGNLAMALTDASAAIAAALVVRALLQQLTPAPNFMAFISYSLLYLASLALLTAISHGIQWLHNRRSYGPFQQAIGQDQRSVALNHSGIILASAMVMANAIPLTDGNVHQPLSLLWQWLSISLVGLVILVLWQRLLSTWVMLKINPDKEIALQDNGGIAALAAAQWIGVAWLLDAIMN
ncbi:MULTISPECIES: hypothetical protein [Ferrimonas]|uniref:DUF350 domain-containing protein n=1 Tax=Ferrimonas TaxID=44011 RepID=UPI0012EB9263|nr:MULTISPECIES: hypothetical protein [Ferrimonas]USD37021.1 hypothetical protein J8Z22_18810 [Ferrimonas sp. SCSIO 43195]